MATETIQTTSNATANTIHLNTGIKPATYADLEWSHTTLNYYKDAAQPPAAPDVALSEHEQRVQRRSDASPNIERVPVRIRNIKGTEDQYRIDTHGFAIGQLETRLADFNNDGELRKVYFPEVTELLKRETGAKHVFQYEWHVRSTTLEDGLKQDSTGAVDIKGPVRRVHIDESPATAVKEFGYYLKPDEEPNKHLQGRPFAIYNVWKPLKTVRRDPLCLCDARTVAPEDLYLTSVHVPNMGEIQNISLRVPRDGREHGFSYVREQRADQALIFRIFDSRIDGVVGDKKSHGVAHSSFNDPGTENQVPRESVEVRNFCVF